MTGQARDLSVLAQVLSMYILVYVPIKYQLPTTQSEKLKIPGHPTEHDNLLLFLAGGLGYIDITAN